MSENREWTWNRRQDGQDGVTIEDDHLVWWSDNWAAPFASGGACEQSFEEFLQSGPVDRAIPQADLEALRAAIEVRLKRT
jgi:hypothetical protein